MVTSRLLAINNEGQKYIYEGHNIRDFGQLLNSLSPHLWHLTLEQEIGIKTSTLNPCLSPIIKYAYKKICCQHIYIFIYIYTYIYIYI